MSPEELAERMRHGDIQLVDIREPWEHAIVHIEGSEPVPMGELTLDRLREDVPVVLYCHHGVRSARTLQRVRELGRTNVDHLEGGIDAYSRTQDPSLPRY